LTTGFSCAVDQTQKMDIEPMPDKSVEADRLTETTPGVHRWAPLWNRVRIFLQFGVPLLVLVLVWYEIREMNIHMVRQALGQSDRDLVAFGIFFAFLAIAVMGLYDALVFPPGAEGRLTFGRRWLIGSLLFSWTDFVSIGPIGGPALRTLIYRRYGLRGLEITRGLVAYYIGMSGGLIGWLAAGWAPLPGGLDHPAFRVVLAAVGSLVFTHGTGFIIGVILNRLPGGKPSAAPPLTALGVVSFFDWGLTLVSFFLLIRSVGVHVPLISAARTVFTGQFAGVISMIPAGLGSADAVWFKGFDLLGVTPGTAAAAIVVFRAGFYLVPWLVALVVLYVLAAFRSEQLRLWQRRIVAGAVLVNGFLLLFSAATPDLIDRLAVVEKIVPLGAVEVSHLLATLSAAMMLFLVRGLLRGYRSAYVLTMALFAASALAHPLKGGDYEEAVVSVVLMILLFGSRKVFTRRGRVPLGWELALALGVASLAMYLVVGLAAFEKLPFDSESWTTFAYQAQTNRFLRAAVLLAVATILVVIRQSLRPVSEWITPKKEEIDRAEAFFHQHADSADALQVGGGDKAVWFWEPGGGDPAGVVLFQRSGDKLIVCKDPVLSPQGDPAALIGDLLTYAETMDVDVVFSMITGKWMAYLHDFGYHFLKVTKEAIVPLEGFTLEGGRNAGFRRTLREMDRAGIVFSFLEPPFTTDIVDQLRAVSDAWLASKGGREMQFTPCYFSPEYIQRNPVAVAREPGGRIIAFLNVLITRPGGEAALDFIRYIPGRVDNVMDFVIVQTLQLMSRQGYHSFSLGGAPMGDVGLRSQSRLVERGMHLFSQRTEGLYNFQGLLKYKNKFHPEWSPRYMAYPKPWDWASSMVAALRLIQAGGREARHRIAAARLGGV